MFQKSRLLLFNFSYTFYPYINFSPYFHCVRIYHSIFVNPLVRSSASTKSTSIFGHERYRSRLRDWHRCHPRSLARDGNIHGRGLACLTLLSAHRSQDFSPRVRKGNLPPVRTKYLRETKFSVIREGTGPFDLPSVTVEHRERAKRLPLPPIDPNNCTASRNFHNAMERLPWFSHRLAIRHKFGQPIHVYQPKVSPINISRYSIKLRFLHTVI